MSTVQIVKTSPMESNDPLWDIASLAPAFKSMPILYLEFIENKTKIIPDLINKPYDPPSGYGNSAAHGDDADMADPVGAGSTAPSIAELQAQNPAVKILPKEYAYHKPDSDELQKERNDVLFQYEVLKRMHPQATIPEFTMYSDPKIMAQKYEVLSKKLSLDSNVENWKRYMIVFVMGCEVVLGKLNFDMQGFAQQQIISMNTYDSLLVELAEKSYMPTGSRWPVELRLFGMLLMNVVLFVVSKIITNKTGLNLLGTINQLTNPKSDIAMNPPTQPADIFTS